MEAQLFRVTLLRRLQPLPLTVRTCWCGLPLEVVADGPSLVWECPIGS